MPMDEEYSAGAVVFYAEEGVLEYLILHYEEGHWDFPKGHIEEGETPLDAMFREIKEETGLDVELVEGFQTKYDYKFRAKYDNFRLKHKTVQMYLARARTKDVRLSHEHVGYEWLEYMDALKRLSYENGREILRRAHEFILKEGHAY